MTLDRLIMRAIIERPNICNWGDFDRFLIDEWDWGGLIFDNDDLNTKEANDGPR